MKNIHVLAIPYPAQGHVHPLMQAARCLTSNGIKVTFVNTEFNHKRVMSARGEKESSSDLLQMVWIQDGLEPSDDRNDLGKLTDAMSRVMPGNLEELIKEINKTNDEKISCIIADAGMGWAIKVAKKMGIKNAVFSPVGAIHLVLSMSVQKLMKDQVIDSHGVPLKNQKIQLSPTIPSMDTAHFPWACFPDPVTARIFFDVTVLDCKEAAEASDRIICNSSMELEPGVFNSFPKILPIGPLLETNSLSKQVGHFWKEDSTCITWLDQQPVKSVIYVAFGSLALLTQHQFEEMALGFELTNKPFLWVLRPGLSGGADFVYPNGYMDRVANRGKIVEWAPQQEVLHHPSVACFMSHCGWNSAIEGVSNGLPFLCWPYFADQFVHESYICEWWKIGLGFNKDDNGIVTRGEIKSKVEQLLSNKILVQNALDLKEKVLESVRAGNSNKNLGNFINWIKEGDA